MPADSNSAVGRFYLKTFNIKVMTLEKLREKRKESILIVCTLGLASLFVLKPFNIFEGASFDSGAIGFVLKCTSYIVIGLLLAGIMFVIHFFKLIYYSIEIKRLTS